MERGKTIPTSRWPDWLNAAGLLAASWIAIAALSLQARPGAEVVAVAFPPWWGAQQAMVAAGSAGAAIVRMTAVPSLLVVRPDGQRRVQPFQDTDHDRCGNGNRNAFAALAHRTDQSNE